MPQDTVLVDCDGPKIQNTLSRLRDEEASLISRLTSLESAMQEHEIRIARLKNSRTPIFSIPPELLASIFLAGYAWSRVDHNITISHVCHNWRDIALSLPALWAFINLSPTGSRSGRLEIISMFLERSRGHPLDVSIRFDRDGGGDAISSYDSDNDGEDLRHDRPGGRLASQGAKIFPTLARWRALSIHNLYLPDHEEFIEPLLKGPAPILEKIDLMNSFDENMPFEDYYSRTSLFQLGAPKLAHVRTCGLAFSFFQSQSITELVFEDPISRRVYEQIQHSSPQLVDLQFKGEMAGLEWPREDINAIELPSLRRLTVTLTDSTSYSLPHYLPIILHSLRAPILEAFTIYFRPRSNFSAAVDSALDSPFVALICMPVLSLSLVGANLDSAAAARITARFPRVTHISLTHCPSLSPLFQHLLNGIGDHITDVDGPSELGGIAWPVLHTISISEPMLNKADTEVLHKLVIDRDNRGMPLSSWTIGNCTSDMRKR